VIDLAGRELLDTLIRPLKTKRMPTRAKAVHGIGVKDLRGAPSWVDVADQINAVLKDKVVLAYNAEYDERLVRQTAALYDTQQPSVKRWECLMLQYSQFVGEPSWRFKGEYKWQKLPGSAHGALADCHAALAVLKIMSADERPARPAPLSPHRWSRQPRLSRRCRRCDGKGSIARFSHVRGGVCFDCGGTGIMLPGGTALRGRRELLIGMGLAAVIALGLLSSRTPRAVPAQSPPLLASAPAVVAKPSKATTAPEPKQSRHTARTVRGAHLGDLSRPSSVSASHRIHPTDPVAARVEATPALADRKERVETPAPAAAKRMVPDDHPVTSSRAALPPLTLPPPAIWNGRIVGRTRRLERSADAAPMQSDPRAGASAPAHDSYRPIQRGVIGQGP
jgi:DNA polymerase-3 subunit epsilon